jgi:hypothetical protein
MEDPGAFSPDFAEVAYGFVQLRPETNPIDNTGMQKMMA